jgi:hypothetical protein
VDYPGFIGPTNQLAGSTQDVEDTINWFIELSAPGKGKTPADLRPTPGLDPFVVLGAGPVWRLFYQDGREFAIAGSALYEVLKSHSFTLRGGLTHPGNRVPTIATNGTAGNQLAIMSGGDGFIYNLTTNTLAIIADGDFLTPSSGMVFFDGYFVNLLRDSRTFQISDLEDGTAWDPLDVFEISTASDNIITMAVAHRELWLMGSQTTQVWADTGDPDTPLQPVPGSLMQQGIWAPDSLAVLDNTLFWLGQSSRGINVVYRANGYNPERISTNAIETYLRRQPYTEDCVAWTYQLDGHTFYVLYGPSWEQTLMYDVTTNYWTKIALWDLVNMVWKPHLGRCSTQAFGMIHVGDRQSPAVYRLDFDVFTDGVVVTL